MIWDRVANIGGEGCWLWQGALRGKSGYGGFSFHGRDYYAHRFAYCVAHGIEPESLSADLGVLHTCDTPLCCNPDHLWLGTNNDNVADKVRKGRQSRLLGRRNPKSKLTAEQVKAIRAAAALGARGTDLALAYGISSTSVYHVINLKNWAHL